MRTWFVTGCSTGIGRGIANAVLKAGDQAVVTARNVSKIQAFEMQYPNTCMVLPIDLIDVHSMECTGKTFTFGSLSPRKVYGTKQKNSLRKTWTLPYLSNQR